MNNINVTNLFTYPIKSTKGISLIESEIGPLGLKLDRTWAVIDENNHFITGRENQNILKISTNINESKLLLSAPNIDSIEIDTETPLNQKRAEVFLFKKAASAFVLNNHINDWLSTILGQNARMITIDKTDLRKMSARHNPKEHERIGFSDGSPIHLFSKASLAHLNAQLDKKVSLHNFRPNIIVDGCEAYAEDNWKSIKIGACEFEVTGKMGRCIFTTIDPNTLKKDSLGEPLKTLSRTRKEGNRVGFGMCLIPRKLGIIKVGDEVELKT